ncbi:MAG TPA: hypothetical protein VGN93_23195 [Shinella sp.]|jgi:CheY-like chemotaxis protein|uniref:hypothetical protein n=1 Tax=Shinella sp. TaxID=1870904 RepID=UPI002E11E39D|nr:hypothetical protein [Shinella sp.]
MGLRNRSVGIPGFVQQDLHLLKAPLAFSVFRNGSRDAGFGNYLWLSSFVSGTLRFSAGLSYLSGGIGMDGSLGHVLVVEDEYLIAVDLVDALEAHGAVVVGPVSGIREAIRAIEEATELDGAILDLNLRGEISLPVADLLRVRNIPFVLTTGYGRENLPEALVQIPLVAKPFEASEVIGTLVEIMRERQSSMRPLNP